MTELINKYQPALEEMETQHVRITRMGLEDGKLYIRAAAPSEEAKNRVWDRIKTVDPSYSDLRCDIRVQQTGDMQPDSDHDFERTARSAPKSSFADALASTFRSDGTPPFGQMVSGLFGRSSGEQRAGVLNSLLAVTPASLAAEVLGMMGGKQQVTSQEAELVPEEAVQKLAAVAEQHDPSVIDRVSEFYADHPNLVKTLGIGALTMITSRLIGGRHRSAS